MPVSCAAWIAFVSGVASLAGSVRSPVFHVTVMRIASRPASSALSISTFAAASVGCFARSSAAPIIMYGPPAHAGAANAKNNTTAARTPLIGGTVAAGYADKRASGTRREPAEAASGEAGRLPFPRRARRRALRREGEVAAPARALVLPGGLERHAARDPSDGRARREHRDDRDVVRGRGAASRAEPRQASPAAVQRAATRRQVVPVHRRHRGGRVPASDVHA